jgi:RNA 2',3'-cyclic 3'-phosphodiesterase
MKRTFIGLKIDINPVLTKLLSDLKRILHSENLKWADQNNLHLTLRFLGDTDDSQLSNIYKELEILIPRYSEFTLEIKGLGTFGKISAPKILWTGINMQKGAYDLVADIEEIVCRKGFVSESKPYTPHLTLCRIKSLKNPYRLTDLVDQYKQTHFFTQQIEEIILYESVLKSFGAVYVPLRTFRLNKRLG